MAHSWIIRFLEHRIADKRILRLIAKWLKVGTVEDGRRTRGGCGAPQGAVLSPILANVYLHYAFDLWVHRWRLPIIDCNCDRGSKVNHWQAGPPNPGLNVSSIRLA